MKQRTCCNDRFEKKALDLRVQVPSGDTLKEGLTLAKKHSTHKIGKASMSGGIWYT